MKSKGCRFFTRGKRYGLMDAESDYVIGM